MTLKGYRAEQDKANEPLHERLTVVKDMLADHRRKLERLLELYLAGDFPKEMLVEREKRFEDTIEALEKSKAISPAQLKAQTLTREQIESLEDFALRIAEGLEYADEDFETRRQVMEMLDVRVTLTLEDGEKVAYVQAVLGDASLSVASTILSNCKSARAFANRAK